MSNPKAQSDYHQKRKEIERKLKAVDRAIEAHRAAAGDGLNWGHVGDLAHVVELLEQVERFLGGQ